MTSQALDFVTNLFPQVPRDLHLLVWTSKPKPLPGKPKNAINRSNWFQDPFQAAYFAEASQNEDKNVYLQLTLSPADYGAGGRCLNENTAALSSVRIDIDIKGAGHKKENLPQDLEQAQGILNLCPVAPSLVVHTGGGLQAYWIFDALWRFANAGERQQAGLLLERWTRYFQQLTTFEIDPTIDLARVFRIPGTNNVKPELPEPLPVFLMELNDFRYSVDYLQCLLDDNGVFLENRPKLIRGVTQKQLTGLHPWEDEQLILPLDSEIFFPFEKFELLCEMEPNFVKTWERRRGFSDDSNRSDLSLASYAVNCGWNNNEVAALIHKFRLKHNDEPEKALRVDYIKRTLYRAKEKSSLEEQQTLDAAPGGLKFGGPVVIPMEADSAQISPQGPQPGALSKAEQLGEIGRILGFEDEGIYLQALIKVMGDPISFRLETNRGAINLGSGASLMNKNAFRGKILTLCDFVIPLNKMKNWDQLVNRLVKCNIEVAPDQTETAAGFCRYWLSRYFAEFPPSNEKDAALAESLPFYLGGKKYFVLEHFKQFLRFKQVGLKNYSQGLRDAGCSLEVIPLNLGERNTTRSTWAVNNEI